MTDIALDSRSAGWANLRYAKPLFVVTILTGSFLLFLMQPMIARMALPRLGGAPAVWNSAMLVYQALLLAGYAYAHRLAMRPARTQSWVHIALLVFAMLWLPAGLMAIQPPQGEAVFWWVLWLLVASIGPLFFAVSAQAPLMQHWYAAVAPGEDPYPLYAASNFGSFAGLLAYPLIVEPYLAVSAQQLLWSGLYAALALLVGACALTLRAAAPAAAPDADRTDRTDRAPATPRPDLARCLKWIVLAFVPSGLMLSTTTHLTTDLIAMPLLWVIPLGLYLLSFTIAFASRRMLADALTWATPFALPTCAAFAFMVTNSGSLLPVASNLVMMFVIAIALHTQMYRTRPDPQHLTLFYLMMSVGGVLGGLFCALVAPLLFDWTYEHPILVVLAALLIPQQRLPLPVPGFAAGLARGRGAMIRFAIAAALFAGSVYIYDTVRYPSDDGGYALLAALIIAALLCMGQRLAFALAVLSVMLANGGWMNMEISRDGMRTRSYFGVYTVSDYPAEGLRRLAHGTTMHGMQYFDAARALSPTSYYGPESGAGLTLRRAGDLFGGNAVIGVVGLGTGTLGCYRQPGQSWHFFEIDPAMVRIARDSQLFTYLNNCVPDADIHIGDARLSLAQVPRGQFDVLLIDAFSSDAIPMHLLTREAFGVYRRALGPDGILVVHISNRYVNLLPVLASEARRGGWAAALRSNYPGRANGETISQWVAFAADPRQLARLTGPLGQPIGGPGSKPAPAALWDPLPDDRDFAGWSDDYGSVVPLLKFREDNR